MKRIPLWLCVIMIIMVVSGCSSQAKQPVEAPAADVTLKEFTMEEVAVFDGKDDNPAYIIVDKVVYDVSDVNVWKNGLHQSKFKAGKDYTDEIKSVSPHGSSVLKNVPIVGTIK